MEKKIYEKPQIEILVFAPGSIVQAAEGYWENGVWYPSSPDNDGDIIVTLPDDEDVHPFF